jgi:hypothetical protein
MEIKNKKWTLEKFYNMREEVLNQWPIWFLNGFSRI